MKSLSRRTLLRATGIGIALPWLEAMTPTRLHAGDHVKKKPRLAFVYVANGVNYEEMVARHDGS